MVGDFEEEDEGIELSKRHLMELHKRRTTEQLYALLANALIKMK